MVHAVGMSKSRAPPNTESSLNINQNQYSSASLGQPTGAVSRQEKESDRVRTLLGERLLQIVKLRCTCSVGARSQAGCVDRSRKRTPPTTRCTKPQLWPHSRTVLNPCATCGSRLARFNFCSFLQ